MEAEKYISIMNTLEALKRNTRHSWISDGRHESVAEHSWRLAMMAYFVKDEFPQADINKVILMCLCHDIGEAFTGDIPAFLKTVSDEVTEENEVMSFIHTLPEPYKNELNILFTEMNELKTIESKIYKALDKMEVLIQHNEADISTWIPLEYELNLIYGEREVQFSEYIRGLKELINEISVRKLTQSN